LSSVSVEANTQVNSFKSRLRGTVSSSPVNSQGVAAINVIRDSASVASTQSSAQATGHEYPWGILHSVDMPSNMSNTFSASYGSKFDIAMNDEYALIASRSDSYISVSVALVNLGSGLVEHTAGYSSNNATNVVSMNNDYYVVEAIVTDPGGILTDGRQGIVVQGVGNRINERYELVFTDDSGIYCDPKRVIIQGQYLYAYISGRLNKYNLELEEVILKWDLTQIETLGNNIQPTTSLRTYTGSVYPDQWSGRVGEFVDYMTAYTWDGETQSPVPMKSANTQRFSGYSGGWVAEQIGFDGGDTHSNYVYTYWTNKTQLGLSSYNDYGVGHIQTSPDNVFITNRPGGLEELLVDIRAKSGFTRVGSLRFPTGILHPSLKDYNTSCNDTHFVLMDNTSGKLHIIKDFRE
jgi:hypothetical protein